MDYDVFKKFQQNGDVIKNAIKADDLSKDKAFQKAEEEVQEKAKFFINRLKMVKVFDGHKLQPQTYDLKMLGDPLGGRPKNKKDSNEEKKKKAEAEKKQKKKVEEKLGGAARGFLDENEDDGNDNRRESEGSDSDDDNPTDKYDPLSRHKEGGTKLNKKSMLQSAVEQTALELGKAMPVMSRGPELELSTIKDVEDLKHQLA